MSSPGGKRGTSANIAASASPSHGDGSVELPQLAISQMRGSPSAEYRPERGRQREEVLILRFMARDVIKDRSPEPFYFGKIYKMKTSKFAGACVIKEGKILLVQEAHKEAYGLWSLPLGHVEDGESELETALRETKEETGYEVILGERKEIEIDGKDFRSTANFDDHLIYLTIFEAEIKAGDIMPGSDVLDARWISVREVDNLLLRGSWVKFFVKN